MPEKEKRYRVTFTLDVNEEFGPGTIVVAPAEDEWRKSGSQVLVDVVIWPRKSAHYSSRAVSVPGYLGFLKSTTNQTDVRELRQLLATGNQRHLPSEGPPGYFTMLRDMEAYRNVVTALGPDEASAALSSLRDVVEAEDAPGAPSWLKAATDSRVFRSHFLRTSEAFFAWKNAGTLLKGLEFEKVGRVSEALRITFQLAGRPNEHQLEFRFTPDRTFLPKRFAVVIGKNGVGKSQSLFRIADAAMRGSDELTDGRGDRPSFNRLLAFYPTAIAGDVFPPERRRRSKVWYRRYSLGGPGFGRRRQTTADLVVEVARTEQKIGKNSRFQIFTKAIMAVEGYRELALRTRGGGERFVKLEDLLDGNEEDLLERFANVDPKSEILRYVGGQLYPLSSGELTFIRFAALASLHIENSSLLLFDEPETHLHPNFISQFVVMLDNLLRQTGSVAIIATHSVYFVREAFEDQVQILRSGPDREITVEVPLLKTFGADVGAISFFVFGEDEPSRLAQRVEMRIADEAQSWNETFEKFKDDLSLDLLGEIRAAIEDREAQAKESGS